VRAAKVALEGCRAFVDRLERQVARGLANVSRHQALAEQYVREGNDTRAREELLEKARWDKDVSENKDQLSRHKQIYEGHLRTVQAAARRLDDMRHEAKQQGVRLEMSKVEASLSELGEVIGKAGLGLDNLSEVNEEIETQIDRNRAKGLVVHDLGREATAEVEAEQRARESAADSDLAALKSRMNGSQVSVNG
jgi:phage shock protein A